MASSAGLSIGTNPRIVAFRSHHVNAIRDLGLQGVKLTVSGV
jgi:hypothetical protein